MGLPLCSFPFPFPDGAAASFSGYACELRVRDYYLNFVHRSTENSTFFFLLLPTANKTNSQESQTWPMTNRIHSLVRPIAPLGCAGLRWLLGYSVDFSGVLLREIQIHLQQLDRAERRACCRV